MLHSVTRNAIYHELDQFKQTCLGNPISRVIDFIPTNSYACLVGIFFHWAHFANGRGVCNGRLEVCRDVVEVDGAEGVGSFETLECWIMQLFPYALAKAPQFVSILFVPSVLVIVLSLMRAYSL